MIPILQLKFPYMLTLYFEGSVFPHLSFLTQLCEVGHQQLDSVCNCACIRTPLGLRLAF